MSGVGEVTVAKLVKSCLLYPARELSVVLDALLHHSALLLHWRCVAIGFLYLQNDPLENLHGSLRGENIVIRGHRGQKLTVLMSCYVNWELSLPHSPWLKTP